jgi:hypothetical protein
LKITAEPRSDQINAEDFLGGSKTYTIAGIREGAAEQKYDIVLEGEKRVWRPPPTVLRTLMKAWESDDSADWIGKRVTLYCDETVTFGKETPGGIRVSHVSGIDKPATVSVTEKRGRRKRVTVQPLPDAPAPVDWAAQIEGTAGDVEALRRLWQDASKAGANEDTLNRIAQAAQEATSERPHADDA